MATTTEKPRIGRPPGKLDSKPRGAIDPERIGDPAADYLSAKEVAYRYGISPQRVRIWAQQGRLPEPYKLGENTVRWKRSEIEEFEEEHGQRVRYKHGQRVSS